MSCWYWKRGLRAVPFCYEQKFGYILKAAEKLSSYFLNPSKFGYLREKHIAQEPTLLQY